MKKAQPHQVAAEAVDAAEVMRTLELHAEREQWTDCAELIPQHLEFCRRTAELAVHDRAQRLMLHDIACRTERVLDRARRELAVVSTALGDSRRGNTAMRAYLRTDPF